MQVLPLFPLQLVAFPNEILNLHIFEPRYKKLIRECEKDKNSFGIPPYLNGKMKNLGTELEILDIFNLKLDGSCDVKLLGKRIFKVNDFIYPDSVEDYLRGNVVFLPNNEETDFYIQTILFEKLSLLFNLLGLKKKLPIKPDDIISFNYGHYVGLNLQQELQLIEITDEIERIKFLLIHLENFLPHVLELENLKKRALSNGHVKYFNPPLF